MKCRSVAGKVGGQIALILISKAAGSSDVPWTFGRAGHANSRQSKLPSLSFLASLARDKNIGTRSA